jgi:hypothetical protein
LGVGCAGNGNSFQTTPIKGFTHAKADSQGFFAASRYGFELICFKLESTLNVANLFRPQTKFTGIDENKLFSSSLRRKKLNISPLKSPTGRVVNMLNARELDKDKISVRKSIHLHCS